MAIINVSIPFRLIRQIEDYSRIVNEILKHNISFNILKFSTTSNGINLLLEVPEDKTKEIAETLRSNDIQVNKKGRIILDEDKCIHCGACISLCPTDALRFVDSKEVEFEGNKCIGCLICQDACPRGAIKESK
jgi:ferredoxin